MFHLILGHFLGAFFWQVTCYFKAWEGKNPKLKTMHKSKLKQGRYNHLKTIAQNGQKLISKFKRISNWALNYKSWVQKFWTQHSDFELNSPNTNQILPSLPYFNFWVSLNPWKEYNKPKIQELYDFWNIFNYFWVLLKKQL